MTREKPIAAAYRRCEAGRQLLCKMARQMECTEDKGGILWERFVTNAGKSLVLVATPHWWDVYATVCDSPELALTLAAIKAACEIDPPRDP